MKQSQIVKKNTDEKIKEWIAVRKLFLYHIGISKESLFIKQIEKEVSKDFRDGKRPNYVYELTERLFPIGSKQYSYQKFKKLFNSDEILKGASYLNSNEFHLAIDGKTTKDIKHRIFESYYNFFKIYNQLNDNKLNEGNLRESDLEINVSEPSLLNNEKSITIKVSDKDNNYIKTIIKCIEPIDKKNINEQNINIQFLQKSRFSIDENKMNIIKMMDGSNNHSKKINVYSSKLSAVNLKPTYLDVLPKDIPENIPKDFDPKELRTKLKYVLNLRGFVEFLLLCGYKNDDYKKIDRVIENLSDVDEYVSLNQEIDNRFGTQNPNVHRNLSPKEIFSNKKNLKNPDISYLSSYKIKNRFPFLAFYNEYKNFFKPYLIAKTLKRIADTLKPNYKDSNISELKYKFTYEYLQFVKRLLSPSLFAGNSLSSKKPEELQGFSKFFNECSLYVKATRIKELDLDLDSYDLFNEQIKTANLEKKYEQIIENNEDIVSIKSLLPVDEFDNIIQNNPLFNLIKRKCRYSTNKDALYFLFNSYLLIKNSVLKKIAKRIGIDDIYPQLEILLKEYGIPLNCSKSIERWIIRYRSDSLSNEWSF